MALPSMENQNRLIAEVLKTGPADGYRLLDNVDLRSDGVAINTWRHLLEATRSSEYATAWREAYGRKRESFPQPNSILELALQLVYQFILDLDQLDARSTFQEESIIILVRLIANSCVDNDHNRRLAIHAGAIECLMAALGQGLNPSVLVPALYNVCIDVPDLSERFQSSNTSQANSTPVTIAEERLAVGQSQPMNILLGIQILLSSTVVQICSEDVLEYLTDLLVMAATPMTVVDTATVKDEDPSIEDIVVQLQSPRVGGRLACASVRCKISILQTILAISHLQAMKTQLARTGAIFPLALFADLPVNEEMEEDDNDDEQEQRDNAKLLEDLKTSLTKLVFDVCQMAQFRNPPKYGIARQSVDILVHQNSSISGTYSSAIALLMLYGFIDCDARANLLILENERLIHRLFNITTSGDKAIVYLALSLASKLAVTWSLRGKLCEAGAVNTVHFLITSPDLGYDIPLNSITFLELLIRGQPERIKDLIHPSTENGRTLLDDIFSLFERNHDAISFEIGRLMIETISTLSTDASNASSNTMEFLNSCEKQMLCKVLTFMATKGQEADPISAQRIWYALGLLCLNAEGQQVVRFVVQEPGVNKRLQEILSSPDDTPGKRNILSIRWTLEGQHRLSDTGISQSTSLDDAVARMSLA